MLDAIRNWLNDRQKSAVITARAKGFGLLYYAFANGMPTSAAETMLQHEGIPDGEEGRAFYEGSREAIRHWKEFQALKGSQK